MSTKTRVISFGPFRLLPARRILLDGDKPLRLGNRALDILLTLIERAGDAVSKDELIARVWPHTTVEESNLKVQVAALRRAIGDGRNHNRFILTVPGQGYCFNAPILSIETNTDALPPPQRAHNLPATLTRPIGRGEVVGKIAAQSRRQRLLTIVGPGGVGKTTLAIELAEELLVVHEQGVWLVDFAPLSDPRLVPSALASVLGLEVRTDDLVPALLASLKDKQMLLVFDNCDRVIDAAAALATAILSGTPRVHILATSRESLRIEGEHIHRLRPLASPPAGSWPTATEALAFPAVQLFVERAEASLGEFDLSDVDAPLVADICTKLDGLPLAIELAAARIEAFGLQGLASRLDDRLHLLTTGHRTAQPQHQTMRATLDWSYEALPEVERQVLQRLGIFAGSFSAEAASAVAASDEVAAPEVAAYIANLVATSLVAADVSGSIVFYRLLETTRIYAREKLLESGELDRVARQHAEYYQQMFEGAEVPWQTRPTAERSDTFRRCLDEVRVALDWAFSPTGELALGVALTAAAVPLWLELSMVAEVRGRVEQALVPLQSGTIRDTHLEMHLIAALGASLFFTAGECRIAAAWSKALELATDIDDALHQLRALWGLWTHRISCGEYGAALELAQRFCSIAARNPGASDLPFTGDRMLGLVLHSLGDQTYARHHTERMLQHAPGPRPIRFPLDQRVAARATLARILWLQGFPEQAMRTARSNVDDAQGLDHPLSLCYAVAVGEFAVALFVGDLAAAEQSASILLDHATRYGLTYWHARREAFTGILAMKRGEIAIGLQLLGGALEKLRATRSPLLRMEFAAEMALGLARIGRVHQGLATVEEAIDQAERTEARWYEPELLRIKGDLIILQGTREGIVAAQALFAESLALARRQSALSWELRTAISLARLRRTQGRAGEAHDLLESVYGRFTEGFQTADLLAAKSLLDQLIQDAHRRSSTYELRA